LAASVGHHNPISVGNGFDSSTFEIFINGNLFFSQSFNDLASAQAFFTADVFNLGHFSNGTTNVAGAPTCIPQQVTVGWISI
jgi:hypothetical protein